MVGALEDLAESLALVDWLIVLVFSRTDSTCHSHSQILRKTAKYQFVNTAIFYLRFLNYF
jgi:hypothetical protein